MEELRSTEVLDKEIQEDARRKADKILKNVDFDSKKILDDVKIKIEKIKQEKSDYYANLIVQYKRDIEAVLPLEKGRFLVSFENDRVVQAIDEYVHALGEEKQLFLLKKLLVRFKDVLNKKELTLQSYGFDRNMLKDFAAKELSAKIISCTEITQNEMQNAGGSLGMILETSDKTIKCRVTMSELVSEVLDSQRYELVSALFGRGNP